MIEMTSHGEWVDGELAAAAPLTGTEAWAARQAGGDVKITPEMIRRYLLSQMVDPSAPQILVDEFMSSSTESGETGGIGWGFTNGTLNIVNPEAGHPGIVTRTSTAVIDAVASMFTGGGGAASVIRQDQIDVNYWVVKPGNVTGDHDVRIGFAADFTALVPATGIYFEKLAADANWFAVCRTAGVQTRADTGVAYTAVWTTLKIRRVDATHFAFSVNGGVETEIAATVPGDATVLVFGNHIVPKAAIARAMSYDFFSLQMRAQAR
jgi:hypothetical protein